ncbi:phospholipase D-like domain-containing protein [Enterobacter sp. Bisph1]|uniref:phospholipase D-like domain-containing protein n=1 Tax=Enterobacter sp. Bisph1 TaxID=1274399 RepID=UPI00057BE323|nr:phospholipase D-like domain-containing protein [Enterobacter sp. Bisph1]
MSQNDIVVPVATSYTTECQIVSPWFVQGTEYPPTLATYKPLVNGEEAFAAVYHAIANAKRTVDIICWGFQPSMYFIRDGKALCIGDLLCKLADEKKVQVRVLGWEMPLNAAGGGGEANLPGKGAIRIKDRAGQSTTDERYAYDRQWFSQYSLSGEWSAHQLKHRQAGIAEIATAPLAHREEKLSSSSPLFVGRGFNPFDRAEIAYRAANGALDPDLSPDTILILAGTVTHHQKTVLVDYDLPDSAVGFVMGHNMLDEYWDTDRHSAMFRPGNKMDPRFGANGTLPRQDISSQVTGPILEHLHHNFATAWQRATGQDLLTIRNAVAVAKQLKPRALYGTPIMAQLLRTQPQEGMRDIETLYLNAVNNATQFIYIENQYFRWPPLAELINKIAERLSKVGHALHLFVVTNVTDEGIGAGTLNTQRMLEELGQANTIPEVTKLRKITHLSQETFNRPVGYFDPGKIRQYNREMNEKVSDFKNKSDEIQNGEILSEERPGLKVHICSLVAPDSPPEEWVPVYIHSKLMIVNDVFTTHGSANINTRSMQVDSEMNIAHEWASVTRDLRRRLWNLHTGGRGGQDDAAKAFDSWAKILSDNNDRQRNKQAPIASLTKFLYDKPTLSDLD